MNYSMINITLPRSINASARRTFGSEQCLLARGLVIDRIEGKGEVLSFVPRVGDLDDSMWTVRVHTICSDNGVFVCLGFLQEGTYSCHDADRHYEAGKLLG